MQDDYYAGYREYLREGMRIEIGIPLSGGGIFRDWAIVSESGQDELLAQISRDVLPSNVRVDAGSILDVTVWIKGDAYTCSGIVTEKLGGRVLRIRLFGAFTLRERRQFFRMNLNLRIRYALLDHADRREVESDWEHRRDIEHMKFQGYDDVVIAAQKARHAPATPVDWHEMLWAEVDLGGGGICISLPEPLQPDQLLNMEIHLPLSPPRQIQTVAQVIYVVKPEPGGDALFQAGMQFIFLDERDRDLVFRHISVAQIDRLRAIADRRDLLDPHPPPASSELVRWQQVVCKALGTLLFLILAFYLVRYLIHYQQAGSPNEIQKTYEKAIRQYRHEGR